MRRSTLRRRWSVVGRRGAVALAGSLAACWAAAAGESGPPGGAGRAARRTPLVELFEACKGSVVTFTITRTERVGPSSAPSGQASPNGRTVTHTERGSGFVIHADGYILTCAHALRARGKRRVRFVDGRTLPAEVVAHDDAIDLALLKVDAPGPLKCLKLGSSKDVMVGERAIVLGDPFGFGLTLGAGVVTGTQRSSKTDFALLSDLIQTDAGVNPGTSGGPLLNILGEVIGVATSQRRDADGIGFATSIDSVRAAFGEMLAAEQRYGFVLGLKVAPGGPVEVTDVAADSPAARAGVKRGDVIAAVDGKPVAGGIDFHLALVGREGGGKLKLKLLRGGEPAAVTVALGRRGLREAEKVTNQAGGLTYRLYRGGWGKVPDFAALAPAGSGTAPTVSLGEHKDTDSFGMEFTGYVSVPSEGLWAFYTRSDDGSRLHIGERLVVDNDGLHGSQEKRGLIRLKAGLHAIRVTFFEALGDDELVVSYEGPGVAKQPIPAKALSHASRGPRPSPASRPAATAPAKP